jgi:hypothetical protein
MSDYMPTTEEVRDEYSDHGSWVDKESGEEAFDRWLAAHDAEIANR